VKHAAHTLLRPSRFRKLVTRLGVPPGHADDATQNGLLRYCEKNAPLAPSPEAPAAETAEREQPPCRGQGVPLDLSPEVLPLVTQFVVFEALNFRRRACIRNEAPAPFDQLDRGDWRPDPEDHAAIRETYKKVLAAIEQLTASLKAVLVAHVFDGASLAEIARARGITEKTAENQLAAARLALRARMERLEREPPRSGRRAVRGLLLALWKLDVRKWFAGRLGAAGHAARSAISSGTGDRSLPASRPTNAGMPRCAHCGTSSLSTTSSERPMKRWTSSSPAWTPRSWRRTQIGAQWPADQHPPVRFDVRGG
jgi:hypothetical protein